MTPSTELLILGLLRRTALSAYALDRTIRAHVPLYRPFKHGNTYRAVASLFENGLLLQTSAQSKRGPRATKRVFRLSASGERRFQSLLRSIIRDVQSDAPSFEIALVLLGQLPRNEARTLLAARAKLIGEQEQRLERIIGGLKQRVGSGYVAMLHAYATLQSEARYLRSAIKLLDSPKWYAEWVSDDGAIVDPARVL